MAQDQIPDDPTSLPLTAAHWGTHRVRTEGGRVVELLPFEEDPEPSPIAQGILDVLDGPTRITAPMARAGWLERGPGHGTRGAEPFVELSWDEAERLVAAELERVRAGHGNRAIYAGSYGWASAGRFHHAQSQLKRFLNCIGGFTNSVNTYSFAAAEVVMPHILGGFREFLNATTSWDSIAEAGGLMVAFGGVPLKNGQIDAGGLGRHVQRAGLDAARAARVEFVNIGPIRDDMPDGLGAEWLPARPGTDTAILLGIAHTLVADGLYDEAFLARYTVGFERFRAYLLGETDATPKDAEWAAAISEVPAAAIRCLARRMAATRTMISVAWALTRQEHGEQPLWAAIAVAAMLGQIGLPGGGFGFGYSACNSIGNQYAPIPAASVPQGDNPVAEFIPVARIADMLLGPGTEFEFDGGTYTYPDIRLVWWAGGNPFHHHQDLNRLVHAWQKPETVIASEWCWNALARHADIVLPCTTALEREDIGIGRRDAHAVAMARVVPPPGEARDDHAILAGIARHMGVEAAFTEGRDAGEWLAWLYDMTRQRAAAQGTEMPGYEAFRARGWFCAEAPAAPTVLLAGFRADPEANRLNTPSGRIEIFSERVAGFGYDDCPGHPVWREPAEWRAAAAGGFALHLISNQPVTKLHSQLDHGAVSRAGKIGGREPVVMNPADAAARGIRPGDLVRVFNARGACLGSAALSDALRPGVARMSTGAWYDPAEPGRPGSLCKHGNPNVLTPDCGTSRLARGPAAMSCMVEVERFEGEPPGISAFAPPEIRRRGAG